MKIKSVYALFFVLLLVSGKAQDIHFSQFNMSPGNLNPAFTGFFDGDVRGIANYRSQWRTVPVAYSTVSLQMDLRNNFKKITTDKWGAGMLFNNDIAGDSKYGTTQLYIPLSYIHQLNTDSNFFMSLGLQPGISNVGFRTNKLSYDSQWDGDAYNPALSSGENYSLLRRTYFDMNMGLVLQYQLKQKSAITFGASMSHLTTPRVSYFKNDDIELDMKFNSYISFTYPIAPKLNIEAEYLFQKQGKFKENVLGTKLSFTLNENNKQSVNAGVYLRAKDAVIARVGYNIKQWQFGMSYDVNTSNFNVATNRKGAIEFALIYIFQKEKIFVPKKRACPIYM